MTDTAIAVESRDHPMGGGFPVPQAVQMMNMIERIARDVSIPMERLERLFELRDKIAAQQAKADFNSALSAVQPELPVIAANGKLEIRKKDTNELIQSTPYPLYADIADAVKGPLAKVGLAISHRISMKPKADGSIGLIEITGILSHSSGHQEETTIVLPHDSTGSKNAVQAIGSSTQYGRRYTTCLLLNITSRAPQDRDDDGRATGKPVTDGGLITAEQVTELTSLITTVNANMANFLNFFDLGRVEDMPASRFAEAVKMLNAKARQAK